MQMSAKSTGDSEVLVLILELLSQVKSDCHEIFWEASLCGGL